MKEQNIEQLFKNSFSNFEADVNPNAWANISQGLQTPVPAQHSLNGSHAGKPSGMLGKTSVSNLILFLAIIAAIVGTAIYFGTQNSDSETAFVKEAPQTVKENSVTTVPLPEPVVVNHVNPEAIKNVPVETHNTNKTGEPKSVTPESAVVISDKPKEKQSTLDNATENSKTQVNTIDVDKNSAGQKSAVPDANSVIVSKPADVDVSVGSTSVETSPNEPTYSDIISTTQETDSKNFTFFVPNVFSPNGDLQNDNFTPMGLNFKDYELIIFDRSGSEIFRSKDIANKWDGKLRDGTPAPVDVYGYLINVKDMNNVIRPYSGNIMLRR
jgi:gliding motility-associated-like protein